MIINQREKKKKKKQNEFYGYIRVQLSSYTGL